MAGVKFPIENLFLVKKILFATIILILSLGCSQAPTEPPEPKMNVLTNKSFSGDAPLPERRHPDIDYDWSVVVEEFVVAEPKTLDPNKKYGVLVYITPGRAVPPPADWQEAMEQRNLLYIAPKNVGNEVPNARRMGQAVLAAGLMKRDYNIDPKRIYVSGLSGGARVANATAYIHPELFTGAIMHCGACFIRQVPQKKEKPQQGRQGGSDYTVIVEESTLDESVIKKNVRFALITGPKDFRYGNMLDIYEGGYQPAGYQARMFDIPDMGHKNSSGEVLGQAIDYLDNR